MDFYKILESNQEDDFETIKKHYYKLSRKYHPDKNKNKTNGRMQNINMAYEILSDEDKRDKYDTYLNTTTSKKVDYIDLMYFFYRQTNNKIVKLALLSIIKSNLDIEISIDVKLEDVYDENSQRVQYNKKINNTKIVNEEVIFSLNDYIITLKNKGDKYKRICGNLIINLNIICYDNFIVCNNKLLYISDKLENIKLHDGRIIKLDKHSNKKLRDGYFYIIENKGIFNDPLYVIIKK